MRKPHLTAFLTAMVLAFACAALAPHPALAKDEKLAEAAYPSLLSSIRNIPPMDFCGERVPLENQEVKERLEKEVLLMLDDRAQTILWMKRTGRYFPYIEQMLKLNGMPDDLKYLTIVESGLRPLVGSHKGAKGYWQFIGSTGKKFGLAVNSDKDERSSFFHSTRAAIDYLKELHSIFNSWTLAAAAYNMGESGLEKNIGVQKTDDFYHLHIPEETQRYVLRAVAVKLLLSNPQKYGFDMQPGDYYKPIPFDRVTIVCPTRVHIQTVAEAAGTWFKTIKDMNPEVKGYYFESGTHTILIPDGAAKNFHSRYAELLKQSPQISRDRVHVVKQGESLSTIAERLGVTMTALIQKNGLNVSKPLHVGQKLVY